MKELLLKYIAGETNDDETGEVEKWLKTAPEHFKEFEELWDLWYAVGSATNVNRFNVDKGWSALVEKKTLVEGKKAGAGRMNNRKLFKRMVLIGGSVAAAIAALILVNVLWETPLGHTGFLGKQKKTASGQVRGREDRASSLPGEVTTISTAPEQRKSIRLRDGSVVWLNGNTTIRFNNTNNKERVLYLRGQAFFNISHQAGRPFVVKTSHAAIRVLGTRFDVMAYPADHVTEAVLTEGSILFTTEFNHKKISRHLMPGEKATINYLSGRLNISQVDTVFYASWKEGILLFRDQSFADVARAMEHKYNVVFIFRDTTLCSKKLNGYLQKESLKEALKALQLTLRFKYSIDGQKVIIYK